MGAATYGGHRLWLLGKWALKELRGKWSDFGGIRLLAGLLSFANAAAEKMALCGVAWVSRLQARVDEVRVEDFKGVLKSARATAEKMALCGMASISRLQARVDGVRVEDLDFKALLDLRVVAAKLRKGFAAGVSMGSDVVGEKVWKFFPIGLGGEMSAVTENLWKGLEGWVGRLWELGRRVA